MADYCLTRAAELDALGAFREFIAKVAAKEGINPQVSFDLQLAVDEAATNVIQHGYAGMNPGSLMLEIGARPDRVIVTLTDFGHPFEPFEPDAPDAQAMLEGRPSGGFGLFFIHQSMDEVDYYTDEEGNHLVLTKKLR